MKVSIKYLFIVFLTASLSCYNIPKKIPTGRWSYKLLANNIDIGSAIISNQIIDGNYVSTSEINLRIGNIVNKSKQIITETKELKPIKLVNYNKIITSDYVHEKEISAVFRGMNIYLKESPSNKKSTIGTLGFEFYFFCC